MSAPRPRTPSFDDGLSWLVDLVERRRSAAEAWSIDPCHRRARDAARHDEAHGLALLDRLAPDVARALRERAG